MTNELKQKIHASMKELLVSRGWPDKMSHEQIIASLPDLWKKLESEGLLQDLVSRGFNYQQFVNVALHMKSQADAIAEVEAFFRRGRR